MLCRWIVKSLALVSLFLPFSPVLAKSLTENESGTLINTIELGVLTKDQVSQIFAPYGRQGLYDVRLVRASFVTTTPDKKQDHLLASGLIMIPQNLPGVLPWLSVQHGTLIGIGEAPTLKPLEGVWDASQGFVTVVPDYIGFGDSSALFHPYLIEAGYVKSGIDFLKATQAFAGREHLELGPLFLKGYSEGGYATLALQRALETDYAGQFPLLASSPSAGPYDTVALGLGGVGSKQQNPLFTSLIFLSLETWGGLPFDVKDVINYDTDLLRKVLMSPVVDPELTQTLPTDTRIFFQPTFIDDFLLPVPQTPAALATRQLFAQQDLSSGTWSPKIPTRFYHCVEDEVVPVYYTQKILAHLAEVDAAAPVSSVLYTSPDPAKPYTHVTCPGLFDAVSWFKELLQAKP